MYAAIMSVYIIHTYLSMYCRQEKSYTWVRYYNGVTTLQITFGTAVVNAMGMC